VGLPYIACMSVDVASSLSALPPAGRLLEQVPGLQLPWLNDVIVGPGREGVLDVLADQVLLKVEPGREPGLEPEIRPLTTGAQQLLAGPYGQAARDVVRGAMSVLHGRPEAALEYFGMSTSEAGFQALGAATMAWSNPSWVGRPGAQGWVQGIVDDLAAAPRNGLAEVGWLNVDVLAGERLLAGAAGQLQGQPGDATAAVHLLAHELEHAASHKVFTPQEHWLEEGRAEVLSRWTGATARVGEPMGISTIALSRNPHMYDDFTRTVEQVTRLASDLDPRDPNQLDEARTLLRSVNGQEFAFSMSSRIASRYGLHEGQEAQLRSTLLAADAPAQLSAVLTDLGLPVPKAVLPGSIR
jgi:hypothetical protein